MKKSLITITAYILATAITLAGCSSTPTTSEDTSANSPAAKPESTSQSAAPDEVVTIDFLDVMPTPERTALLEDLIVKFEAQNSSVKPQYTSIPWDEAYKKLVTMGSAGSLPDIVTTDVGIMQTLSRSGYILDLNDRFNSLPAKDDFTEATIANRGTYTFEDRVYTVPDGYLCQGIFVRTDWLEQAGYNVEDLKNWTWDDYFEVNEKLTDASQGRFGCAFRGGANGGLRFYEYLGSMLEVTEAYPNGDNQSIYSDPQTIEHFKKFYSLYTDGNSPQDSINWGFKEMVEGFVSGQCATLNQTPEVTVTCQESMEEGTWTVLPHPVKAGAEKNSFTWGYTAGYAISANSSNPDAAWSFIEWLSSPEINLEYSQKFGCLPLYKSTLNDPFFQQGDMKGYADALLDPNIQYLAQPSELSQWGYFLAEFFKNETQKYMSGQQTAEESLANVSAWMSEQYDADIANA